MALLGVSIEHRHSAFSDAEATAQIFLKLVPLLAERHIITLGQAIEASKKTPYARLKY
jgi:DNA polymerase-3 subunit epsilon